MIPEVKNLIQSDIFYLFDLSSKKGNGVVKKNESVRCRVRLIIC